MKKSILALASSIGLAAFCGDAVLTDTFELDTVGSAAANWNGSAEVENNTTSYGKAGFPGYSAGADVTHTKALRLAGSATRSFGAVSAGVSNVDMMLEVSFLDEEDDLPVIVDGCRISVAAKDGKLYVANKGASANEWTAIDGTYTLGQWIRLTVIFSEDGKTAVVRVDGIFKGRFNCIATAPKPSSITITGNCAIDDLRVSTGAGNLIVKKTGEDALDAANIAAFDTSGTDWVAILPIAPGADSVEVVAADAEAAKGKVEIKLSSEATTAGQLARYFKKVATQTTAGKWSVSVELDETVVKSSATSMAAAGTTVTIVPANVLKGLYYGVAASTYLNNATTPSSLTQATADNEVLNLTNTTVPNSNTKVIYYKVIVSDKPAIQ